MSQTNYDKQLASNISINRISAATGIDNFSETSKTRLITDAVAEDVFNFRDYTQDTISNLRIRSASGQHLDAMGADFNAVRRITPRLFLDKSDQIISIDTQVSEKTFGSVVGGLYTIPSGSALDLSGDVRLTLTEDAILSPSSSSVYISGILSTTGSSIDLSSGHAFKLPQDLTDRQQGLKFVQLTVLKPLYIETIEEDDEDYRLRIELSRSSGLVGLEGSIRKAALEIPGIKGHAVFAMERGSGSVDLGFTTHTLERDGEDPAIEAYLRFISNKMDLEVAAFGVDISIFTPTPAQLSLIFSHTSGPLITDAEVINTVYTVAKEWYDYSEDNYLDLRRIEIEAKNRLQDTSYLAITEASLYDPAILEVLSFYHDRVSVPRSKFMQITEDNITVEV